MDNKNTNFPQYRMLSNARTFYHIIDARSFEEVQKMGSKLVRHLIKAEQYPEMLRIQDMLNGHDGTYLVISEQQWLEQTSEQSA
jgi:hypothetical protein